MPTIAISRSIRYRDYLLLTVMAVGAACGMIYEYLVAHYAGRILGSVDTAVYGMIGLMVVSMGVGAFYARVIKCPYTGFAWLESIIALIGGAAVLAMAAIFSVAFILPLQIQHAFGMHESIELQGGMIFAIRQIAEAFPYIIGFLLGFFIGMEIPFIARIREDLYANTLKHNAGTVYGVDYIGGGIGAAIWIFVCLQQPIIISATLTALLNVILGAIFLFYFYKKVKRWKLLILLKSSVALLLILILINGQSWMNALNNMLYMDSVVYAKNTKYQNLVITERANKPGKPSIIQLYINGHLQFSSADEIIYHSMLVTPAMMSSARQKNILIVGGGDGLAARDVFQWNPEQVTLIDLDPKMIEMFKGASEDMPDWLSQRLTAMNQNSLTDKRLKVINGDAFKVIEDFEIGINAFDVIIVDLPDPNHPDLNKLYSSYFYSRLSALLSADGSMVVQSTSPYHSKKAFLSIGNTMQAAGLTVDQYHANVPSFGEWGWSIATKSGIRPVTLIQNFPENEIHNDFLSKSQITGAFAFSKSFFDQRDQVKANHLNEPTIYNYHAEGWRKDKGVYDAN